MALNRLLLPLTVALLAAAARADVIVLRDGTRLDGVKVVSETYEKVEYKQPKVASNQSKPAADVRDIEYAATSADFREGLKAWHEDADLATAAAYFDSAATDDKLPANVRATARRFSADCWLAGGNLVDAAAAYADLIKSWPDTRHLAAALLGKGQALLQSGSFAEAKQAFDALKAEVAAKSLGERWEIEGDYNGLVAVVAGKLKGADGQAVDAVAGFEALRKRAAGKDPELEAKCEVQLGRLHLNEGKLDQALPLFDAIIGERLDIADQEVLAGAFNGRGRCLFNQAQAKLDAATAAKGDKARADALRLDAVGLFKEARRDFLRVFTVYSAVQGQQAEALYFAAQCFLNVADKDADSRSKVLLTLCSRNYPNSTWGKEAKKSL
jgi:tetratricopeptide (TPR) repeat protein